MSIEQPYYFLGMLFLLLMIWIFFRFRIWRKKVLQRFGEWKMIKQLLPNQSRARPFVKFMMILLAFACIITSLANLQWGKSKQAVHHSGIDLAIVIDASNSMLAEDAQPNRLDAAKKIAASLIDQLPDARIALVSFAGSPLIQTPLTIDHTAVQLLLNTISADDMPDQGTDIGAAITTALAVLPENQNHYRAMVLISDGEDHRQSAEEALKQAQDEQVMINTVGIGTAEGETIPVTENGQVLEKRDAHGMVIRTRFQPEELKAIADNTKGIFIHSTAEQNNATSLLISRLNEMNKNVFDEDIFAEHESHFQLFLAIALLLLTLDLFIGERRPFGFGKIANRLKASGSK